ncbi:glycoside hydrolase family 31 protein [Lactobacillus sp. ESL0791]|uniref:TIM-barrel domain-containing protein n=1 Tax=Lactobacillus sp. ESL0791 TaxID=2983234 RepID=UPI0023F63513|nr:TIM-barrel domain-containing protein [Lactobacillus sp. ESL0791]MDF7639372.1 glycoside hydrolase family 31 protein [Lactobacillus sp. ESL0791]
MNQKITSVIKKEGYCEITYEDGVVGRLYLIAPNLFRYYVDPSGQYAAPKQSQPDLHAQILAPEIAADGSAELNNSILTETATTFCLKASELMINFAKSAGTMSVERKGETVLAEAKPLTVKKDGSSQVLLDEAGSKYFGGGTQNGRFNLTGEEVQIANTNNWIDQGVTSPAPFYWSTSGYGVLRNTFARGVYDFASKQNGRVTTTHNEERFDAFYFFADTAYGLIHAYQQLTGLPLLLPLYGFYEAHLNAYNRDYWVETNANAGGAIRYPNGKYYKEYQPQKLPKELKDKAIRENLNGEGGEENYELSARGMLDQYLQQDLPLGWFLPNDGYGAGYGQTKTLAGNVANLREFVEYANSRGVEVGLWTQQNLLPVDPDHPKTSDRDFEQELRAGVMALKTDVAWVGSGYSFGLNGTQTAAAMIKKIKGDALRPFIITVDGWAGTQNTAAVWTGDEKGGQWEYIRFQIPTYIGEGLSGQPNVASDMDGIFYGGNPVVNTRDYQWKAFTPIQLNMDGWGTNPKNPFAFSKNITAINRAYLKQKTMLLPYIYSIAHEAVVAGKPLIRAMFLEYPALPECYTNLVKYQYLWGESFLIAPIYQNTQADQAGNDIRNGIYLPDEQQIWFDYYTGKAYRGGQVVNNFAAPLWKLPVFVKAGAIIPKAAPTNTPAEYEKVKQERQLEIYPAGENCFNWYEDDDISDKYKQGQSAQTKISSKLAGTELTVIINPTAGTYAGMTAERPTELAIKTEQAPTAVSVAIAAKDVVLHEAKDLEDFQKSANSYFWDRQYVTNPYLREMGADLAQNFLRVKIAPVDISQDKIVLRVKGVKLQTDAVNELPTKKIALAGPAGLSDSLALTAKLAWEPADENLGRVTYNVKVDGLLYTGLPDPLLVLHDLRPASQHWYQVQTVTSSGYSGWSAKKYF